MPDNYFEDWYLLASEVIVQISDRLLHFTEKRRTKDTFESQPVIGTVVSAQNACQSCTKEFLAQLTSPLYTSKKSLRKLWPASEIV
jgi:hypothetical protein